LTYYHYYSLELLDRAPLNPPDPIFNLNTQFKVDSFEDKVNVGIGAYRTDEGKPWVLPTVKKVEKLLVNDPEVDHEYLPIDGLASFTEASARLVLGHSSPAILENRVGI
jgi:aspartate aminotransferase, cytoplasmic